MSGGFYPWRDMLDDRKFGASVLGSIVVCAIATTVATFCLSERRLHFQEIAQVQFTDGKNVDPSNVAPISDIEKMKSEKTQTEFAGYITNFNDICKNVKDTSEKLVVLVNKSGTSVGKIKIGPQTCALLDKLNVGKQQRIFSASDEASSPASRRQFWAVASQKGALDNAAIH